MPDEIDWSLTTWEGNRRQQHRELLALPFREKLEVIEGLGEVARIFAERRRARGLPVQLTRPDSSADGHSPSAGLDLTTDSEMTDSEMTDSEMTPVRYSSRLSVKAPARAVLPAAFPAG